MIPESIRLHLEESVKYAQEYDEDMNDVSWGMQEGVLISYNDAIAILNSHQELEAWKQEALSVMPDYQAIGKALNIKLGESVHDKILPGIEKLKYDNNGLHDALQKKINENIGKYQEIELLNETLENQINIIISKDDEINRLKGLLKTYFINNYMHYIAHPITDREQELCKPIAIGKWEQFKKENNLI